MKVITLKQYNNDPSQALELVEYPMPVPGDEEVLIEVQAASLNPIDAKIRSGYGRSLFEITAPLPIVLGRDFSGIISKIGRAVQGYVLGDEIFGVVSPFRPSGMKQGSHGEFITLPVAEITKKPKNLDHIQAASLPYVALTTYSALVVQGKMQCNSYKGLRVLVHAGAGGVGSYAIQFLKALGAYVITTCSTANVEFVRGLGADEIIDYTRENYSEKLKDCDIAYDLLGSEECAKNTLSILRSVPPSLQIIAKIDELYHQSLESLKLADESWDVKKYKEILERVDEKLVQLLGNMPKYISIISPMMTLMDTYGFHTGMRRFVASTLEQKFNQAKHHGRFFNYSFFAPNQEGLALLADQITDGKIKACVGQVFSLKDFNLAHSSIETQRTRGKIVFDMKEEENSLKLDPGY